MSLCKNCMENEGVIGVTQIEGSFCCDECVKQYLRKQKLEALKICPDCELNMVVLFTLPDVDFYGCGNDECRYDDLVEVPKK